MLAEIMGFLLECRDFQKETREKSSLHVQTGLLCCYRQNSGVYISDGTRCAATLMTSRTPSINHQETVHLKEKEFQPRLTPTSASVWPLHSHLSMSPICLSQTAYNGAIWEAEIYERSGGGGGLTGEESESDECKDLTTTATFLKQQHQMIICFPQSTVEVIQMVLFMSTLTGTCQTVQKWTR